MLITAYGERTDGRPRHSGESFGVEGTWFGCDRGELSLLSSVVIDLGNPADGIGARAMTMAPDVVVLTHDDDDHIGGAAAALGAARGSLQVWLPADWWFIVAAWSEGAGTGPAPAGMPVDVRPDDVLAVLEAGGAGREGDPARDVAPRLPGLSRRHPASPRPRDAGAETARSRPDEDGFAGWLDAVARREPEPWFREAIGEAVARHRETVGREGEFAGTPDAVAKRVVSRAKTIVDVVRAAAAAGEIRWFTVDLWEEPDQPWRREGIPGAVTLVNAHEAEVAGLRVSVPADVLLLSSALTVQNRRALVTFVWPERFGGTPGFLAWSDSAGEGCEPLKVIGGRTPWPLVGGMSAPHHGSRRPEHDDIWAGRATAGDRSIGVLLCNNREATRRGFWKLPRRLRAATHGDKGRSSPRPRDAYLLLRGDPWWLQTWRWRRRPVVATLRRPDLW